MNIQQAIETLVTKGYLVEQDPSFEEGERWLLISPEDPTCIENHGHPDFFTSEALIEWADMLTPKGVA